MRKLSKNKKNSNVDRTKLSLKKETLRTLADSALSQVAGGGISDHSVCLTYTDRVCGHGGCGY